MQRERESAYESLQRKKSTHSAARRRRHRPFWPLPAPSPSLSTTQNPSLSRFPYPPQMLSAVTRVGLCRTHPTRASVTVSAARAAPAPASSAAPRRAKSTNTAPPPSAPLPPLSLPPLSEAQKRKQLDEMSSAQATGECGVFPRLFGPGYRAGFGRGGGWACDTTGANVCSLSLSPAASNQGRFCARARAAPPLRDPGVCSRPRHLERRAKVPTRSSGGER